MKKIIQILLIIILASIIALIFIFVFNPFDLRTKLIGNIINSYLSSTIEGYSPENKNNENLNNVATEQSGTPTDKHPLLTAEQEKTLETYGVDVSQLPTSISAEMEKCFIDELGQERADEIVGGASPSAIEIFKARSCLGK